MTQADFEVLESRIREELSNIGRLGEELMRAAIIHDKAGHEAPELPRNDSLVLRSLGSILHDFYCAAESLFEAIARNIDCSIPSDPEWHRTLLTQMSLRLSTRRPPVLRKETVIILDEFRAFRHVFRNVYGFALDPERLERLLLKFPQAVESLTEDMAAFLDVMQKIAPNQTNDHSGNLS
mgnify:FL=1